MGEAKQGRKTRNESNTNDSYILHQRGYLSGMVGHGENHLNWISRLCCERSTAQLFLQAAVKEFGQGCLQVIAILCALLVLARDQKFKEDGTR